MVTSIARRNSFNALLGKNGISTSHLCHRTVYWSLFSRKPCFPLSPSQLLPSSAFAPRSLNKPVRQAQGVIHIEISLRWSRDFFLQSHQRYASAIISCQAATAEAKCMITATNVFPWSTEGFTESTRVSSNVCVLLCVISYSFFQDPQEI